MQDVEGRVEFTRKQELLRLRDHLDKLREIEKEVSDMEQVLADPDFAEHHHHAERRLTLAQRAHETFRQLVAIDIDILGLQDDKQELERQLAALDN
ncbi:hypothetical protein QCM77_40320 [Bradyrhizobium sp. SSUT18]|uniref:hypothetical protein n=1 Tax=Bradyrhizobium sp. SSUT18 TaxID=3040602 RepID=UPI002448FCD8|nr:hypothetical protein [Bradyrhizobium sp. SSUT18]MDH2406081.1 hypothetical protein [Bradyrhizobium sp. SSUT18]